MIFSWKRIELIRKIKLFHQKHDKGSSFVVRSHNTGQQWKLSSVGKGGSETSRCYNRCVPHIWVFCHRDKHVLTARTEKNLYFPISIKIHCIQRPYCIRTVRVLKPCPELVFGNVCNWKKRLHCRWSSWNQMFDAETRFLRCLSLDVFRRQKNSEGNYSVTRLLLTCTIGHHHHKRQMCKKLSIFLYLWSSFCSEVHDLCAVRKWEQVWIACQVDPFSRN